MSTHQRMELFLADAQKSPDPTTTMKFLVRLEEVWHYFQPSESGSSARFRPRLPDIDALVGFHSRLPSSSRSQDTYNYLLDRALKATNRRHVVRYLLTDMARYNIRRNSTTWELLIINGVRFGNWEEAFDRIHGMASEGMAMSLAGWTGLLEAATMAEPRWTKVMRLYSPRPLEPEDIKLLEETASMTAFDAIFQMYRPDMSMDDTGVVGIVRALCKVGRIDTAEEVVESSLSRRIPSKVPPPPPSTPTPPTSSTPTALPSPPRLPDDMFATRLMHALLVGKVRLRHTPMSLVDYMGSFFERYARFRPCFNRKTFYILVCSIKASVPLHRRFLTAMHMADVLGHEFVGPRAARTMLHLALGYLRRAGDSASEIEREQLEEVEERLRNWLDGQGWTSLFTHQDDDGMKPSDFQKIGDEVVLAYRLLPSRGTEHEEDEKEEGFLQVSDPQSSVRDSETWREREEDNRRYQTALGSQPAV
jgi:hypothetical protein